MTFAKSPYGARYNSPSQVLMPVFSPVNVLLTSGQTTLSIPSTPFSIIFVSSSTTETIDTLTGGIEGGIVIIVSSTTFTLLPSSLIMLNSSPATTPFEFSPGDVLSLINHEGVWQELFRNCKV